jgi:hypothetical protein
LSDRGFSKGPIAQARQGRHEFKELKTTVNFLMVITKRDAQIGGVTDHRKEGAPFWQRIASLGKRTKGHKGSASTGERTALKTKTAVKYRANGHSHRELFSGIQYLISSQAQV